VSWRRASALFHKELEKINTKKTEAFAQAPFRVSNSPRSPQGEYEDFKLEAFGVSAEGCNSPAVHTPPFYLFWEMAPKYLIWGKKKNKTFQESSPKVLQVGDWGLPFNYCKYENPKKNKP
jgi:hypothetical protein